MEGQLILFEILVPCARTDGGPIHTKFHSVWDKKIQTITGGISIFPPTLGAWRKTEGTAYREEMMPVRIVSTRNQMQAIVRMTKDYYEQASILAYVISTEIILLED